MNGPEQLLHLSRRHCEERRRYLAELEQLARRLRTDAGRVRSEIAQAFAAGGAAADLPLLDRGRRLDRSVAEIDGEIAAARTALAAAEQQLQQHERDRDLRAHGAAGTSLNAGRSGRLSRRRPPPLRS